MDKKAEIQLFIATFLTAGGWYLLVSAYKLIHFSPHYDLSIIIPILRPEINPDLKLPLYVSGWLWIVVIGTVLFLLFRYFLFRKKPLFISGIRIYLRSIILINIWLIYELIVRHQLPETFSRDITVYNLSVLILLILLFFGRRITKILNQAVIFLDFAGITILLIFLAYLFFIIIKHRFDPELIRIFLPYFNTVYINSVSTPFLILIMIISLIFFIFWAAPYKLKLLLRNRYLHYFLCLSAILYIIFGESIIPNPVKIGFAPYTQDFNPYVSPVNDLFGGKTLYVNSISQYGFLVIYTLAAVFKVIPLNFDNYFLTLYATTVLFYIILFFSVKKWLGLGMALLSLILIVQPLAYPHAVLRFGWWIIIFSVLVLDLKGKIKNLNLLEFIFAGFVFFWGFDPGMYAAASYLGMILVREFLGWKNSGKKFIFFVSSLLRHWSVIFSSLFVYFLVINILTYIRSGTFPNWYWFIGTTQLFKGGYGLVPLDPVGFYLFLIGLYLAGIIYILYQLLKKTSGKNSPDSIKNTGIVAFLTFYSILIALYYIGRSVGGNLLPVEIPAFVLFCWLLTEIRKFIYGNGWKKLSLQIKIFWVLAGSIMFIFLSLYLTISFATYYNIFLTKQPFTPKYDEVKYTGNTKTSIDYINNYLKGKKPPNRKIPLITEHDNFILVTTKSVDILETNNMDYFMYNSQLHKLGRTLASLQPETLFVQHDIWTSDKIPVIFSYVKNDYHFVKNIGFLDVFERNKI